MAAIEEVEKASVMFYSGDELKKFLKIYFYLPTSVSRARGAVEKGEIMLNGR